MFVVLLTYVKPLPEVDRHLRAHMRFLAEQYAASTFIASGRQVPRTGGVLPARSASKAALTEVLQRDPFVQQGVATATRCASTLASPPRSAAFSQRESCPGPLLRDVALARLRTDPFVLDPHPAP